MSYPKGPDNKRWKRQLKECASCGTEVWVKKCRVKDKNYCSRECASIGYRGTPAWNKGTAKISTENELFRKTKEYKRWRTDVFERDEYTCQECNTKGGRLNADHIKPFAIYKELRLSLDNGRTLCEKCHRQTETYGWKTMHLKKGLCA